MKITLELEQDEQSAGLLSLLSEFLKGSAPQIDERDTKSGPAKSKTTKQNTKSKTDEPTEVVIDGFTPQYDKVETDDIDVDDGDDDDGRDGKDATTVVLNEKELRANIANKLTKLFRTHKEVVKEEITKYNITKISDMKSEDLVGFDGFLEALLHDLLNDVEVI